MCVWMTVWTPRIPHAPSPIVFAPSLRSMVMLFKEKTTMTIAGVTVDLRKQDSIQCKKIK